MYGIYIFIDIYIHMYIYIYLSICRVCDLQRRILQTMISGIPLSWTSGPEGRILIPNVYVVFGIAVAC